MADLPVYWRHNASGGLYGHNPHVDFDADEAYTRLSPAEVLEYLQKVNPEAAAQFAEPKPKPKKTVKKPTKKVAKKVAKKSDSGLDDLDDLLG